MQESTKKRFLEATEACPVIPEIKNDEWLKALPESDSGIAYIVYGDICSIADIVDRVKAEGKLAIVHIDLIVGLSTKEICVDFIKKYTKADGIISMKPAMIRRANDIVEFMPAGLAKVMKYLVETIDKPVVATGLSQDFEDVMAALKAGAIAVATSNKELWDC